MITWADLPMDNSHPLTHTLPFLLDLKYLLIPYPNDMGKGLNMDMGTQQHV